MAARYVAGSGRDALGRSSEQPVRKNAWEMPPERSQRDVQGRLTRVDLCGFCSRHREKRFVAFGQGRVVPFFPSCQRQGV